MDQDSFFWQIQNGKLAAPKCAATLGISIKQVDAGAGTIEVEFQGRPEFTNPAGNIQGGFLAAELYQQGELVASATATAIIRRS